MRKKIVVSLVLVLGFINGVAQINVTENGNAFQLAQMIAGPGITVSNAICTAPLGAAGTFSGHSSLGLDSGIVLTNGYVSNIAGPNNQVGATGAWGVTGTDTQFAAFIGQPESNIFDQSTLEFDFQSPGDSISLKYVFGSEEYPEYVCSIFNDEFAFFISGPGISGWQSMALVPGTNIPVAINSVNGGVPGADAGNRTCNGANQSLAYSQYYVNNGDGNPNPPTQYNTNPYYIQYNGFTIPMVASMTGLLPNYTYRVKLVIADIADATFDSGIFIEAGSLTGVGINTCNLALGAGYSTADSLSSTVIAGCSNGVIPFILTGTDTALTVVHFAVGGTAVSGIDYVPIADSVMFNAGDSIEKLIIQPLNSHQNGVKTITINLPLPCGYLGATLYLMDTLIFTVSPHDTAICTGSNFSLQGSGSGDFLWTPSTGLSSITIANPVATPSITTTYICNESFLGCSASDSSIVIVSSNLLSGFTISASPDSICPGDTVILHASGSGPHFVWQTSTGALIDGDSIAIAVPTTSTVYNCITSNAICSASNNILVTVYPSPEPVISRLNYIPLPKYSICYGDSISLQVTGGGTSFVWQPAIGISNDTGSNIIVAPVVTTTYTCTTSNGFCSAYDTVLIIVLPNSAAIITQHSDTLVSSFGNNYQWYFNDSVMVGYTDSILVATQTGLYEVRTTNIYGCYGYSESLNYIPSAVQSLNNFSPIHLYPNPNNGNFAIEFTDNDVRQVSVSDLLGQQILPRIKVVQRQEFDFSSFSDGIYLLKIERVDNSGSTVFKQVVIQR